MLRKAILFAIIFLYIGLYFIYPDGMDVQFITINLVVVLLLIILFITKKERREQLKKQYLKHSYIFLLGYIIVHFQYYLDFALGNTTKNNLYVWYDTEAAHSSIILAVAGFASFILGYLINYNSKIKINKVKKQNQASTVFLQIIGFICLVVFFVTMNPLYFAGMYGQIQVSPITIYAEFAFQIIVFAYIIQNSINILSRSANINLKLKDFIKGQGVFFNVLIVIYLIGVLLSGDRGPIMYIVVCFLVNYIFVTKTKIKASYILITIGLGAFFITILGQVRLMDKNLSFEDRFIIALSGDYENLNRQQESSISSSTKELATSIKTLQIATATVPEREDYFYGRFQLQYILGAIPFGTDFKNLLFEDNSYKTINSGKFITWQALGASYTYELGTSCVADLYLDLSIVGVVIGMLLFGMFLRHCELILYLSNYNNIKLFAYVLCVVYLAFGIYIARSMILFNIKFCVFLFLLLLFNQFFFKKRV